MKKTPEKEISMGKMALFRRIQRKSHDAGAPWLSK
jgi:hypothetical protein